MLRHALASAPARLERQQSITAICEAARAIPQGLDDVKKHSPEWRYLLQCIRNLEANPALGIAGLARIYQAALGIFPDSKQDPHAAEKNALLLAIEWMAWRRALFSRR
jgi:hypothetical protein